MHVSGIIITYRTHVSVRRLYQPLWKILLCNGRNMCTKVILGRDARCQNKLRKQAHNPLLLWHSSGPKPQLYSSTVTLLWFYSRLHMDLVGRLYQPLENLVLQQKKQAHWGSFWKRHTLSKGQVNIDTYNRFHKQEEATATLCMSPPLRELGFQDTQWNTW